MKSEASKANEWSPAEGRREPFRRKNMIGIIWATRKRKPVFLELRGAATPRRLISPPGPTGQFWDSHKYNYNTLFIFLYLYCNSTYLSSSAFSFSLLDKNIIVPMRLTEKRGKQSQLVESRGGPSGAISTEKYDRDHMGYTQKVTSFSRT